MQTQQVTSEVASPRSPSASQSYLMHRLNGAFLSGSPSHHHSPKPVDKVEHVPKRDQLEPKFHMQDYLNTSGGFKFVDSNSNTKSIQEASPGKILSQYISSA